jgi:hypothetical protein
MAASSPHRSAVPQLQTPRSRRGRSRCALWRGGFAGASPPTNAFAFGGSLRRQAYLSLAAPIWDPSAPARALAGSAANALASWGPARRRPQPCRWDLPQRA